MRWLCVAIVLFAGPARAQWTAHLVARSHDRFGAGPIQARVGEEVEVRAVVRGPDGRTYGDVDRVGVHRVAGPLPEGAVVRWLRVTPRYQHYSNVVPWGAFEGEWRGIERLLYVEEPLEANDEIAIDGAVLRMRGRGDGPGTVWLAAEVL